MFRRKTEIADVSRKALRHSHFRCKNRLVRQLFPKISRNEVNLSRKLAVRNGAGFSLCPLIEGRGGESVADDMFSLSTGLPPVSGKV